MAWGPSDEAIIIGFDRAARDPCLWCFCVRPADQPRAAARSGSAARFQLELIFMTAATCLRYTRTGSTVSPPSIPNFTTTVPGNSNTLGLEVARRPASRSTITRFKASFFGVEGYFYRTAESSFTNFLYGEMANHSVSLPFFADLRARAGVAFDRFLPYITGGVVFADLNNSLVDYDFPFSLNRGSIATEWTVGAGLEYAIDNHWSIKGEYLYMQFPDVTATYSYVDEPYSFKFKDSAQLARVGVNYRF